MYPWYGENQNLKLVNLLNNTENRPFKNSNNFTKFFIHIMDTYYGKKVTDMI